MHHKSPVKTLHKWLPVFFGPVVPDLRQSLQPLENINESSEGARVEISFWKFADFRNVFDL